MEGKDEGSVGLGFMERGCLGAEVREDLGGGGGGGGDHEMRGGLVVEMEEVLEEGVTGDVIDFVDVL